MSGCAPAASNGDRPGGQADRRRVDVAIVGAGPAGLSALIAARAAGASACALDLFPSPGGQYFMLPTSPSPSRTDRGADGRRRAADALRSKAAASGGEIVLGAEVFAAYPGRLAARVGGEALVVESRAAVLATGAHDRVFPFPGWTLPGVMTPGAGQRLLKTNGVAPGRSVVLAGSGAFLLAVAETLLAAGVGVAAIVEARRDWLAPAGHIARHPGRWREAATLLRRPLAAGVPFRRGAMLVAAKGRDRVEEAVVAPLDAAGRPDLGASQTIHGVDAVLCGYGLRPTIELACALGCRLRHDDTLGGWRVAARDADGATSVPGVFAAGEITGVAGFRPALAAGTKAGMAAAAHAAGNERRAVAEARPDRDFGVGLQRLYPVPPGVDDLMREDVILCRCEKVSVGAVRTALRDGATRHHTAKIWTRAGMGRCQGRICGPGLDRLIASETGRPLGHSGRNSARIPVRPVPMPIALAAFEALAEPASDLHGQATA